MHTVFYTPLYETMNLSGKVVVITGSSDGIGKEIALRLAKEDATIVCIARNEAKLQAVCTQALANGARDARVYVCDISNTGQVTQTIEQIVADLGTIDVLINNAGIRQKLSPLEEIPAQTVEQIIQTNLIGLIHCTRLCLPVLQTREDAAVINISSQSGVTAQAGQSVYTASKYGVRGFTDVLKTDLKGSNVRVAGVYQSGTNTQMFNKADQDFPIENFTDPADLADVVAYMLTLPPKIWLHDVRVKY